MSEERDGGRDTVDAASVTTLVATVRVDDAAPTDRAPAALEAGSGPSFLDRLTDAVLVRRRLVAGALGAFVAVGLLAGSGINLGGVLVDGTAVGSIYALVALGIVLVYRSTQVLNFAQGELGTVPAFLVLMLLTGFDRSATVDVAAVSPAQLAAFALVGVLVGALLAVGVNVLVVRRLAESTPVTSLVATAGVSLIMVGAQVVLFEPQNRSFPRAWPGSLCLVPGPDACLLSTNRHNLVTLLVLGVVAVGLTLLFRTELGTALIATAQDPFAASLHGVSPAAMSSLAWGLAGGLGALGGILGAGFFAGLTPGLMTTTFLIPAFTAVILGGITSMFGAVVGGLLVGLITTLANAAATSFGLTSVIPSPPTVASFTVLLLVLLLRPSGLFGKGA